MTSPCDSLTETRCAELRESLWPLTVEEKLELEFLEEFLLWKHKTAPPPAGPAEETNKQTASP